MSPPAYQQRPKVIADAVSPQEPTLLSENCVAAGEALAHYCSGPGVSGRAYDRPHVVLTATETEELPKLDPIEFTNAQFLAVRRQGESVHGAVVVSVGERTLVLRIGWNELDPERPTTSSNIIEAQEVRFDGANWEQPLTRANLVSVITPLNLGQMKALRPALKGMDSTLCFFRDVIADYEAALHRFNLQELPLVLNFEHIRDFGRKAPSGNVLIQVPQGYLELFRAGPSIWATEVAVVEKNGKIEIAGTASHSRPLKPEEVEQLRQTVEVEGGAATKSLFASDAEEKAVPK